MPRAGALAERCSRPRPSRTSRERIDQALERDRAREPGAAQRAAARLRPRAAVGRADGLAGRDDREDRLRRGPRGGARHPRARPTSTSSRSSPAPRGTAAASSSRPRPSPGCWSRCSSRTRAGCSTRRAAPAGCSSSRRGSSRRTAGSPSKISDLRPGAQPGDLADRADEPRDPRPVRARSSTPRAARCSTTRSRR